jgi:hypothetical protein
MTETPKELSARIHYDWLYQCRTCEFWSGDRSGVQDGCCKNQESDLFNELTSICGHCKCWDSYDYETVLEVFDGKWDSIMNPNARR